MGRAPNPSLRYRVCDIERWLCDVRSHVGCTYRAPVLRNEFAKPLAIEQMVYLALENGDAGEDEMTFLGTGRRSRFVEVKQVHELLEAGDSGQLEVEKKQPGAVEFGIGQPVSQPALVKLRGPRPSQCQIGMDHTARTKWVVSSRACPGSTGHVEIPEIHNDAYEANGPVKSVWASEPWAPMIASRSVTLHRLGSQPFRTAVHRR